ncbi:transcription factor Opi1-domain-containing protein [Gamsiella multidivaricata]|uniref:transcription factor Opi1-domain-containing protein n=1 Tax=Gamsiella multidivaricata TaxID=101098 RepID=UPI00221F2ADE|nr:transcription factor Opi1-domain-containing protein [Gamsiella multidivaricata]KAI7826969.1 transcription factor Opi1-domain-containing protein [Gamsiella multidivaricata]
MPPAPARDQTKAQPMSISQLCQQNDSDDELNHHHDVKEELDQDPLDLNADDNAGRYRQSNGHNDHHSGHSSDEFEELDDSPRSRPGLEASARDADEQLAAEALGDMANAARTSSASSVTSNGAFAAPNTPFMSRMSSFPIVNSALKAYESGKQNSKVMKYGAEMVESGVKSLSKPVFDKLEPKLGQLDDFACRQLDKVYPSKSDAQVLPSPTNSARSSNDIVRPENGLNGAPNGNGSYFPYRSRRDSIDSTSSSNTSSRPSFDILRSRANRHEDVTLRQRSDSQSSQRSFQYVNGYYPQQQQQQVGALSSAPSQQFSGWRGVVATVGTASAAGVAIFSEESMKSLKYCLQWLQYAVHHIDHQIGLLRQFLVSLANPSQSTAMIPSNAASTLASIKKEVVETLRKVINVVSRYAGACLPDQAKISVRQFILSMPVRWATINNESVPSTPMGSPSLGPQSDHNPEQQAALNETSERATKVLVLAHESSDMLKSVASIFRDSVDKAENWMDKLRYVGMNPQNNSEGLPSWAPTGFPGAPNGMPGGFPGSERSSGSSSTGLEQYSLRQTQHSSNGTNGSNGHNTHTNGVGSPSRSLKGSPRMGGRDNHNARHAYRQKSAMSGDEDSGSDEEDVPVTMDDSEDEIMRGHANGHAPLKRSMGSGTHAQGNAVRRRKKRGESAEMVAGLGQSNGADPHAIKQEPN